MINKHGMASIGLLSAAVVVSPAAMAQENPTPSRSVESFQSWTLECNNIAIQPAEGETSEKQFRRICEVIQSYYNQQTRTEVARLVFGIDDKEPGKLVAAMRSIVNVSFNGVPSILEGEETLFTGKFNRCAGTFCYALFEIDEDNFEEFETSEDSKLQYALGNGALLTIPISKNGLSDAMKALRSRSQE